VTFRRHTRVAERINVTLEDEQAQKLARLAERMHVPPGTIARVPALDGDRRR